MSDDPLRDGQSSDRFVGLFRPIRLQKAADAVVAVLIDAIRGGLYAAGDKLPRERDLAAQLEVSRPVVREAIDVLRRAGVVAVRRGPNGGATVVSTRDLKRVAATLHGPLREAMVHVAEARRVLDLPVARLASERASDDDLNALAPIVEQLAEVGDDVEALVSVDASFHRSLGYLTQNPLLAAHYQDVLDQAVELTKQFPILIVPSTHAYDNQRHLYAAIKSREPALIDSAVREHLDAFEEIYLVDPSSVSEAVS